jgi:uncharacterized membrane protein
VNGYEILAVLVFFLIGYWVVDYFWPKKKNTGVAQDRDHAQERNSGPENKP